MDIISSILWLTLNVYHEVRGEEFLAQVAVAHVTINRARSRHLSVKDTVLQDHQFSWTDMPKKKWFPRDLVAFWLCLESVTTAAAGHDFTGGATFYHNYRIKPYWAASLEPVGLIGNHIFYRR